MRRNLIMTKSVPTSGVSCPVCTSNFYTPLANFQFNDARQPAVTPLHLCHSSEMCSEMVREDLRAAKTHALLKEHGLQSAVSIE